MQAFRHSVQRHASGCETARELSRPARHYRVVRGALPITIAVSLGAHVLVAAAMVAPQLARAEAPDPAPQLAGETFELPAPETIAVAPIAPPAPETAVADGESETDAPAPSLRRETPKPSGRATPRRPAETPEGDTSAGTAPALYGAVGDRSASDLAAAFTNGFPQAASADPLWRTTSLGSAGEADVVLTLDESGHISDTVVLGAPSPALANAIRRTLALVGSRPFVAKSKVTKLHLVASVTANEVHDGLHGDVFAIGHSFPGTEGSAFFALAIGRRIDVRVRVK